MRPLFQGKKPTENAVRFIFKINQKITLWSDCLPIADSTDDVLIYTKKPGIIIPKTSYKKYFI